MTRQNHPPTPVQAHVKRLWLHGFLAGLVLVLLIFLAFYFLVGWPVYTPEGEEPVKPRLSQVPATPPPAAVTAAKPTPPVVLKDEIAAILAKLAKANQEKNLPQLMSLYAPSFPELNAKAQEISRTWEIYDYASLRFRIEEIQVQDPGNVSARVIWEAKIANRATRKVENHTKTYLVRFTKDAGQWRIKGLDKIS